jgi:hypothetical protein
MSGFSPVRHGFFAVLLASLALSPLAATAAALGLYSGQVPVASQGEADRTEAMKAALSQVLTRVGGGPAVLARADVAKAVGQAEQLVLQFQYAQDVVTENGQPQVRLTLVAEFDHAAVDRLVGNVPAAADAASTAPVETTPQTFHVWVGGVRSAGDYARVISALGASDYVRDTQVEQARGDGMQLRLATAAPLARVLDALNAGAVLRVTNAKPPVDGIDALLDLKP